MKESMSAFLLFLCFFCPRGYGSDQRLVSIGGGLTEIICALDQCDHLVAVDATSIYPPQLEHLPKLGYYRQLSAESVFKQQADSVFIVDSAGPANEIAKLKELHTNLIFVDSQKTLDGAKERIRSLGARFKKDQQAAALISRLEGDLTSAQQARTKLPKDLRVLFVYSRGRDKFLGAGRQTGPDEMFQLLNIKNAYDGSGYKQMSSESLIEMNPDVIVLPESGNQSLDYNKLGKMIPGIVLTKAYKSRSIIFIDDLKFLGFTHRMGQGAQELIDKIGALSWIN